MATGATLPNQQQTLMDHLKELRNRFFAVAVVLLLGATLAYIYREPLLTILLAPLHGQELITLTPGGGFKFILNISIFAGIAAATPFLLYNLYGFLRPVMPLKARRYAPLFLLASLVLIIAGTLFAYYMAIPGALRFLLEFSGDFVTTSLTADSYLSFVIAYILGLALVFQIPLLLLIIHWARPLSPKGLLKSERWIIVFAFIAAAIITPTPDPVNQTLIALPVVLVYQIGVIAVLISVYRARRAAIEYARSQSPFWSELAPDTLHENTSGSPSTTITTLPVSKSTRVMDLRPPSTRILDISGPPIKRHPNGKIPVAAVWSTPRSQQQTQRPLRTKSTPNHLVRHQVRTQHSTRTSRPTSHHISSNPSAHKQIDDIHQTSTHVPAVLDLRDGLRSLSFH